MAMPVHRDDGQRCLSFALKQVLELPPKLFMFIEQLYAAWSDLYFKRVALHLLEFKGVYELLCFFSPLPNLIPWQLQCTCMLLSVNDLPILPCVRNLFHRQRTTNPSPTSLLSRPPKVCL